MSVIRKQLGPGVESFCPLLYSSSIASQICGTFTAQLRHRGAARFRGWFSAAVYGDVGCDNGVAKVRTQRRRRSAAAAGEAALTVHPCTRFQRVVYQPTAYHLSAYLLTYLHTSAHILRSRGEPRPASIARVCTTRTCLSIALPRLASSPRLLPSVHGKKAKRKKKGKKRILAHPHLPPPRAQ